MLGDLWEVLRRELEPVTPPAYRLELRTVGDGGLAWWTRSTPGGLNDRAIIWCRLRLTLVGDHLCFSAPFSAPVTPINGPPLSPIALSDPECLPRLRSAVVRYLGELVGI